MLVLQMGFATRYIEKRSQWLSQGLERAREDQDFRILCALYWGEGSKTVRCGFAAITNSDPKLTRLWLKWLKNEGYETEIKGHIRYYDDSNGPSALDVENWWRSEAEIPECVKIKILQVKQTGQSGSRRGKLKYGTATFRVLKTELLMRILGGIEYLKQCELDTRQIVEVAALVSKTKLS